MSKHHIAKEALLKKRAEQEEGHTLPAGEGGAVSAVKVQEKFEATGAKVEKQLTFLGGWLGGDGAESDGEDDPAEHFMDESPGVEVMVDEEELGVAEPDNYVQPITIDTYLEYRMRHLLTYLQKETPVHSKWAAIAKTIALILSTAGTLLAGVNQPVWVALTVTLGTVVANAAQHMGFEARLQSTSAAARDVRNTLIWVESLSTVQRRTRAVRTRAVSVVEGAVLNIATAWTGTASRPTEEGEVKEKDGQKKDN